MPKISRHSSPANRLVVAIVYDRLCLFELGVATEVFGLSRPEMGDAWYRFTSVAAEAGELRALGGIRLAVDADLGLLEGAGTIIIPGWRGIDEAVPQPLIEALCQAYSKGARILSICSGVFVLAAAGLLSGKRVTTHWRYVDSLRQRYPDIRVEPDVLYIDEGNVLTSAGSAAGIDLCLHLVRRDFGPGIANKVARRLVIPTHRDGGQAQFIEQAVPVVHERGRLGPLLDAMRADLGHDYAVAQMAKAAGMSQRTFLRRFSAATGTTPAKWLLRERLTRARNMLESSDMAVEEIAFLSGFGTSATMRHHFRRQLLTSPASYREAFRGAWSKDAFAREEEAKIAGESKPSGLFNQK